MGRLKQRMFSTPDILPRGLRTCFLIVDFGVIIYWTVVGFKLIPPRWTFKDYADPILIDWNWSFLPLDVLIALTGLCSLLLAGQRSRQSLSLALLSLGFSFCAGLQALSFWVLRGDFTWAWWLPNLFLLLYPLPFLLGMVRRNAR